MIFAEIDEYPAYSWHLQEFDGENTDIKQISLYGTPEDVEYTKFY